MKIILQIKLLPTAEQSEALLDTIKLANKACNIISGIAWDQKNFRQYDLHHACYRLIRSTIQIGARVTVRAIAKVSDAYKLDRDTKREFRPLGAIQYDNQNLTYKKGNEVSIWSTNGRIRIPFKCHSPQEIKPRMGQADLIYRKGKFYIHQSIDVPVGAINPVNEFIGCDFGQTDVCTLSDGTNYNSEQLKSVRKKYSKVRASVQAKGTRNSRRLLKRLSGRERRFVSINNHTISKQIVAKAKEEGKGIAIENLIHIRKRGKPKSKAMRTELNRWSFLQLRQYLTYKAQLSGVPLSVIPPAYTSQTCAECLYIGERKGKRFSCKNCGCVADADHNAARNIATWGSIVSLPGESSALSCALHT